MSKIWNWWVNTTIGDWLWHECFDYRHWFEVHFTTRYDTIRRGEWKYCGWH
mgnify:CR=1 FL=1